MGGGGWRILGVGGLCIVLELVVGRACSWESL